VIKHIDLEAICVVEIVASLNMLGGQIEWHFSMN